MTGIPLPTAASGSPNIRATASSTIFWIDRGIDQLRTWLVDFRGMTLAPVADWGRLASLLYGDDCWLEIHPQSQTGAYQIVCRGQEKDKLAEWIVQYSRGDRGPLVSLRQDAPPVPAKTPRRKKAAA